jgi:hypothetical protein
VSSLAFLSNLALFPFGQGRNVQNSRSRVVSGQAHLQRAFSARIFLVDDDAVRRDAFQKKSWCAPDMKWTMLRVRRPRRGGIGDSRAILPLRTSSWPTEKASIRSERSAQLMRASRRLRYQLGRRLVGSLSQSGG